MQPDHHDYLHTLYDSLHDSPVQRRFRKLAPMPFGVVFIAWAGMREEEMREHFRTMRRLGFNCLKQVMPAPGWPRERMLEAALEEGLIPFWYGEGGWEEITPELLDRLGMDPRTPLPDARRDPRMQAHQAGVLRKRINHQKIDEDMIEGQVLQDAGLVQYSGSGLQLHNDPILRQEAIPLFQRWCVERYGTIQRLVEEWNQNEAGISRQPYTSWEDFLGDTGLSRHSRREYGFIRDVLRFKADITIRKIGKRCRMERERDPGEPSRAGGEMGLFLPFAWRGTDMEGIARVMGAYGSFYPSIHLAWHFEEVGYAVGPCVYMQASLCADWFKGGWSATWESTGGPQQFSGGKGWNANSQQETPGFTVDEGTITQLLLSYLAAGFKGAGLWCWNYRRAGWEAGEYALLNRQNQPGARAIRAGRIAAAAERLRDELWQAHKEPHVGVLVSWDSDCIWAAASVPNRDHFKHYPVHARIGATRALCAANIPWEHVTPADIAAGLAQRYRCILLPAQLALDQGLLVRLRDYAAAGGRVVLDAPGGWFDHKGRVLDTGRGSPFEKLFGCCIEDFQYGNNAPWILDGMDRRDFILHVNPSSARVAARFDNGVPAVTDNALGKGAAVIIAFAASHALFQPGQPDRQQEFARLVMGPHRAPWSCEGVYAYRLAAPPADHYFLINDGPAREALLQTPAHSYRRLTDPVSGEELPIGQPAMVDAYSGRWLRLEK